MADALQQEWLLHEVAMGAPALNTLVLNSSARIVESIYQAPRTETITGMIIPYVSKVGTTPNFRASIQTLSSAGDSSGTVLGGGTPASKIFSPTSLAWANNTNNEVLFDNSYNVTQGEWLATVIDYSSGTIDASNSATFQYYGSSFRDFGSPYSVDFQAAFTKRTGLPLISYKSASRVVGYPIQAVSTVNINSGAGASEVAARVVIPSWIGSATIRGIRWLGSPGANTTLALKCYSGGATTDITALATQSGIDSDFRGSTNRIQTYMFGTSPTVVGGSIYRFSILAEGAVTSSLIFTTHASLAHTDYFPMGQNVHYSSRVGGGNWTDITTNRLFMSLLLDDITAPSGGRAIGRKSFDGGISG